MFLYFLLLLTLRQFFQHLYLDVSSVKCFLVFELYLKLHPRFCRLFVCFVLLGCLFVFCFKKGRLGSCTEKTVVAVSWLAILTFRWACMVVIYPNTSMYLPILYMFIKKGNCTFFLKQSSWPFLTRFSQVKIIDKQNIAWKTEDVTFALVACSAAHFSFLLTLPVLCSVQIVPTLAEELLCQSTITGQSLPSSWK